MKRGYVFVMALSVLTILSLIAVKSANANENFWTQKAPMHEARGGLGVAAVNGKIYAIGGSTESGYLAPLSGIVDTNEEYDPAKDTWTFRSPMPSPTNRLGSSRLARENFLHGRSYSL